MKKYKTYYKVGKISKGLARVTGLEVDGQVFASPGVIKHIKKRHSNQIKRIVREDIVSVIKEIIKNPDYVGRHPQKEGMEFVKTFKDNLMVGLQIDEDDNYIYVATMHPLKKSKLDNRLNSGRLFSYKDFLYNSEKVIQAREKRKLIG